MSSFRSANSLVSVGPSYSSKSIARILTIKSLSSLIQFFATLFHSFIVWFQWWSGLFVVISVVKCCLKLLLFTFWESKLSWSLRSAISLLLRFSLFVSFRVLLILTLPNVQCQWRLMWLMAFLRFCSACHSDWDCIFAPFHFIHSLHLIFSRIRSWLFSSV